MRRAPELKPARIVGMGLVIGLLAFLGIGGWIALAPLHGAVIAVGEVKADSNRKVVQHLEGGIVKDILVRDGDSVRVGQALLTLEDVQVDAAAEAVNQQLNAERARLDRLQAEKNGLRSVLWSEEVLRQRTTSVVNEAMRNETSIFTSRLHALDNQLSLLREQVGESKTELAGLEQQILAETRAVALAQEELAINERLYEKKFVQNTRLLAIKRQVAQQEADRGEHVANQSRVRQHVMDLELRMLELQNQYKQKAADELEASARNVLELQEKLRPYQDARERRAIAAPEDGVVVNLRFHTPGGVIRAGEPILDLVPQHSELIVEGRVATSDIDDLHLGMTADVHLVAYRHRTTPLATGRLVYISADSLTSPDEKRPYYLVRVSVDTASLQKIGNLKLYPGMPADIYIRTHSRTALQYLLEPITRSLLRSLRES